MSINRQWIKTILEFIIALTVILDCNSVFSTMILLPKMAFSIAFLFPFMLLFILNFRKKTKSSVDNLSKYFILFILIYLLVFVILLSKAFNMQSYIFRIGILCPLIILFYCTLKKNLTKLGIFLKIGTIISYYAPISLVFWVGMSLLHIVPSTSNIVISWGEIQTVKGFFPLYYESQSLTSGFIRNCGIFAEAPMFNFVLCAGLLIEFFYKTKVVKWRIVVITITILTTLSTTGYLILIIVFCLNFFNKKNANYLMLQLKTLMIPIILIIAIILFWYAYQNKLNQGSSYEVRSTQITESINAWEKSPLIGKGFGSSTEGNSNSTFLILGDGGIVLFLFYFIPLVVIPYIERFKLRNNNFFISSLIFFILFSFTIVYNNLISYLFVGFGYSLILNNANNLTEG